VAVNHEENEQNAFADGGRVEVKDNGKWWTGVISCVHDNGNVSVMFDSDDSESVDVHPSKVRFERTVRLENEGEKVKHKVRKFGHTFTSVRLLLTTYYGAEKSDEAGPIFPKR
jgi:hypothetical protein